MSKSAMRNLLGLSHRVFQLIIIGPIDNKEIKMRFADIFLLWTILESNMIKPSSSSVSDHITQLFTIASEEK